MTKQDVYRRWYSEYHGMELQPDVNTPSARNTTENGVLYFAEFLMLLHIREELQVLDRARFYNLGRALQVVPGLYDRGAGESDNVPYQDRRTISQDNILAIAAGSVICDYEFQGDIYSYGMAHLFMYNNVAPRLVFPMNPGNYSPWAAMAKQKIITVLFYLVYIINLVLCMFLPKGNTSTKKLHTLELYALVHKQDNFMFRWLAKLFFNRMVNMYGQDFIYQLYSIYYPSTHPLVAYSKDIIYKDGKFSLQEN